MKLKPYIKKSDRLILSEFGNNKFKVIRDGKTTPTHEIKQEIKNANRSLKKAYRAELKMELDKEIKKITLSLL